MDKSTVKRLVFIFVLISMVGLFIVLTSTGMRELIENSSALKDKIYSFGTFGPIMIIGLMAIAIVMSPIPSAPIALAAGALYGHTWGTLYVLVGSTLGATIAFLIARLLGYDFLKRWFKGKMAVSWAGSQNTLMAIIFFSRLMPFMSFDIISYAAGLTSLTFWRFFIATIAGIAPASFVLAHFGGELSSTDNQRIAYAVLGIGLLAVVPLLKKRWRQR